MGCPALRIGALVLRFATAASRESQHALSPLVRPGSPAGRGLGTGGLSSAAKSPTPTHPSS
eukprot:2708656-Pleurochrysis_carterae.AAC.2